MKKNYPDCCFFRKKQLLEIFMRTFIFLFSTLMLGFTPNNVLSQNSKIVIDVDKTLTVDEVFYIIMDQTEYNFIYEKGLFENYPKVQVKKGILSANKLLQRTLPKGKLNIVLSTNNNIIIKEIDAQQQTKVTGKVIGKNGVPLAGAAVIIKGTSKGVAADFDGSFDIIVPSRENVLIFYYLGYTTKEIKVGDQNVINVRLEESKSKLDEVQITAYGKTSKRLATGNVTTITAKEIQQSPVNNVLEALQGRVPGVFIQQNSGRPGAPFNIEIRGRNTFNSGTPLIVIDGVTYPSSSLPVQALGLPNILQGGNSLDYLNMDNIETVNFLKDADATAIYGSRGSYGVILITTKRGKSGKPTLSIMSRNGISFRGASPELLKTKDYLTYMNEAFVNAGQTPESLDYDVNGTWSDTDNTDWTKQYMGHAALTTSNSISYSGGNDTMRFLFGANFKKQEDVQSAKGNDRSGGFNFSINSNSLDQKFDLGLTGNYTSTKNDMIAYDFVTGGDYLLSPPNAPAIYDEEGALNWTDYSDNPGRVYNQIQENTTDNLLSALNLKYTPFKGLVFQTNVGFNLLSSKQIFATPSSYYNPETNYITTSTLNTYRLRTLTFEPNVSYKFSLGKSSFTLQSGATFQDKLTYSQSTTGNDFLSDDLLYNPTFADDDNVSTRYNSITDRYIGFFGILNFNWANKYLLNINMRRDGSTKFGKKNRFGNFGSLAAGWIVSEENWFKNIIGLINFFKVRSSYGITGGDGIPSYSYASRYLQGGDYDGNISLTPSSIIPNPYLHWEKNTKAEVAINLELFKSRIAIDGSYYWNKTTDQLVQFPVSTVTGSGSITRNSPAVIKNWGYEFNLTTKNINSGNFAWSTNFNLSIPKNKLASYPSLESLPNIDYEVGKPITGIKLYNYQGVNPDTGNFNFWKDVNENGSIDDDEIAEWMPIFSVGLDQISDRTEFIDLSPKFYGGIQNNFQYKNFNLNVFFTFTNRMGRNFLGSQLFGLGSPKMNIAKELFDNRWQQPGDITDVPKASTSIFNYYLLHNNFVNSTGAYSNATYVRLQNVNLSYDFSSQFVKQMHIHSFRIYLQGQNLLTISKYKGYDPENLGAGVAPLRTIVAGLNLSL